MADAPRSLFGALRSLPRTVWALGAVSLLTDAAADMIYPLLPTLLARVGATAFALGVMEGVAEAVSAIVKILSGRASDRGRHGKALVVAGYGLASVARPLMAFAPAGWLIVVLRSLDRLGKGIRGAPRDAILAGSVGADRRGIAFGVHRAMDNMGAVVGGGLSFLLLAVAGLELDTVLLLSFVPGALSTLVALAFVRAPTPDPLAVTRPPGSGDSAPAAPTDSSPPSSAGAVRAIAVFTLFALSASADSFLMAHAVALGLPLPLVPLAWISLQFAKSALNVPGGWLADRLGPRIVVTVSYAVYAGAYLAFSVIESPWILWAVLPLYASYYGLGEGAERALLVSVSPLARRGRLLGAASAAQGLALLPANVVFGALYVVDPALAFRVCAVVALAATVLLVALVPRARREA